MSSQAGRSESPGFLDSPPPGSPEDPHLALTQRLPELHDSETFTQQMDVNGNSNDSTVTVSYDAEHASNDRAVPGNHEASGSNSAPSSISHDDRFNRFNIVYNLLRAAAPCPGEDSSPIEPSHNEVFRIINGEGRWAPRENVNRTEMVLPEVEVRSEAPSEEPPAKMRRISSPKTRRKSEEEEQDGETCPICLEVWGNSGNHRLVALKCGHLFGSKCVERWLRAQGVKERSCPTCKSKAIMKDLRFIYARRLVAADTTEITSLQKQVEVLQAEKSRAELELQKSKIAHRACLQQMEVMRRTIASTSQNAERVVRTGWRFALEKNLEVCKDGGCRVLTYNCRSYDFYVSQKSTNILFPGYGVRRVGCVDYKLGQFLHLHPKPIRDIAYSQPSDLLLSVSLDGSARLVERGIASLTVQSGTPLWSCSWDVLRHQEMFVGAVGGTILQYDVRNTASPLHRLSAPGNTTPVVALCSTEYGLLSCQLNSCWLWSPSTSGEWEPRALPVEGPFLSMAYDGSSHKALVSCRPKGTERSKLQICKLKCSTSGETLCEVEQTFFGSARASLMSRASWVRAPGASWVAAHSESDSALFLHGLDGSRTMSLPASEPALDVCSAQLMGDTVLGALSDSRLRLYKAVPTNL